MTQAQDLAKAFRAQFETRLHIRNGEKGSNEVTFTPVKANKEFYTGSKQSNWLKKNAPRFGLSATGSTLHPPNPYSYVVDTEPPAPPTEDSTDTP